MRVPAEAHLPGELRVPEPAGGGLRLSQPPHLLKARVETMDVQYFPRCGDNKSHADLEKILCLFYDE